MTDELQTSKLATSIAETLSPVPQVHGERYGAPSQLYPLLLAPFFGVLSAPAAVDAAHALNALLLAGAAWPAYLLGRSVTRSAAGGLFSAALTAFVPWLVLSSTLLTENAAYPAFVWAIFLCHRALAAPGPGRDAGALGGLLLAFLARTQLLVLAAVLPVALVAHELGYAAVTTPRGRRRAALRAAARRMFVSHRLLAGVYGLGGLVALLLAAVGRLGQLFGTYEEAFRGDLLPSGVWRAAIEHLDYVVVGLAVAPFLLACSWAVLAAIRPQRPETHAFAALLLVLVPMLAVQVASFNLRFTAGGFIQDRYLFYLAAPLAVGAAAALLERERTGTRAALVLGSGALFGVLAAFASFSGGEVIFWASPASAFHGELGAAGDWIGLSADSLVRVASVAVGALLAAAVWRRPGRPALIAVGAAVVAFCTFELIYVSDRVALPVTTRQSALPLVPRDWIDRAVGDQASVALVPNPFLRPDYWWEAEFWNKSVDRVIQTEGTTYTPFPVEQLSLDFSTGEIAGLGSTDLLVLTTADTRLRFADTTTLALAQPLVLVRVRRPYRAVWATRGAHPDGWSRPEIPVRLHVFPALSAGWHEVDLVLSAPAEAKQELSFSVASLGATRAGEVAAGGVAEVDLLVCVPEAGFGEVTLVSPHGVRIGDGRTVGVHVDRIEAVPTGGPCSRAD